MTEAPRQLLSLNSFTLISIFPTDLKILKSHFNEPLKGMEAVCFPQRQRGLGTSVFPQVCGHMNDKTVVLSSVFI